MKIERGLNMKKNKIIGLVTVAALSLGTLSTINNQKVDASSTYKVQLTHNAAIYNSQGRRSSRIILKKGKVYSAYSIKKIKGKKYYRLTKGRYIKQSNAKKYTAQSRSALFTVNVPDEVNAYETPNGNKADTYIAGEHKVYEQKADSQGTIWYRISKNMWISSKDTDKPQGSKTNDSTTSVSQNTTDRVQNTNISQKSNTDTQKPSTKPTTSTVVTLDRQTIEETGHIFVQLVNDWRATQGISPIIYTTSRYDYDIQRAKHNAQSWDANKQSDHHVGSSDDYGEILTLIPYGTPKQMAQAAFDQFINNDAGANYAHRNHLKQSDLKNIGVGIALTTKNGYYKNGISFMASII